MYKLYVQTTEHKTFEDSLVGFFGPDYAHKISVIVKRNPNILSVMRDIFYDNKKNN